VVVKSGGSTLRDGVDIDESNVVCVLQYGQVVLFDDMVYVDEIPQETVGVYRMHVYALDGLSTAANDSNTIQSLIECLSKIALSYEDRFFSSSSRSSSSSSRGTVSRTDCTYGPGQAPGQGGKLSVELIRELRHHLQANSLHGWASLTGRTLEDQSTILEIKKQPQQCPDMGIVDQTTAASRQSFTSGASVSTSINGGVSTGIRASAGTVIDLTDENEHDTNYDSYGNSAFMPSGGKDFGRFAYKGGEMRVRSHRDGMSSTTRPVFTSTGSASASCPVPRIPVVQPRAPAAAVVVRPADTPVLAQAPAQAPALRAPPSLSSSSSSTTRLTSCPLCAAPFPPHMTLRDCEMHVQRCLLDCS
jgi:hypothetical protein